MNKFAPFRQQLDLASPFQLYFNPNLIFYKFQVCLFGWLELIGFNLIFCCV